MDTLRRNAASRFSRRVDGDYEPLNPTAGEVLRSRKGGHHDHSRQASFSRPKSFRDHDHGGDLGSLDQRKISKSKSYRDHDHAGDHNDHSRFPFPNSHRTRGHGSRSMFARPKSYRNQDIVMKNSFSYRRDRARNRHIFLQSYKLDWVASARNSKVKKLKRVAVKVKSLIVSVLSFIRTDSLRSCNSRSAISASLPTRVVNCC